MNNPIQMAYSLVKAEPKAFLFLLLGYCFLVVVFRYLGSSTYLSMVWFVMIGAVLQSLLRPDQRNLSIIRAPDKNKDIPNVSLILLVFYALIIGASLIVIAIFEEANLLGQIINNRKLEMRAIIALTAAVGFSLFGTIIAAKLVNDNQAVTLVLSRARQTGAVVFVWLVAGFIVLDTLHHYGLQGVVFMTDAPEQVGVTRVIIDVVMDLFSASILTVGTIFTATVIYLAYQHVAPREIADAMQQNRAV